MSSYRKDSPFLDQMRRTIRTRHHSIRTEHVYVDWVKRFIIFHKKRPRHLPVVLSREEASRLFTSS